MTFLCDSCKYIDECKPRKANTQAIGCCDFGLFDDEGLIEDWDEKKGGGFLDETDEDYIPPQFDKENKE